MGGVVFRGGRVLPDTRTRNLPDTRSRGVARRTALALALALPVVAATADAAANASPGGRAWLGVQMSAASDGVLVRRVAQPSPAHQGQLMEGDVLLSIDGVRLVQPKQLASHVARSQPGVQVKLSIKRGAVVRDVTVALATHPGEDEVMRRLIVGRAASDLGATITVQGAVDEQASKWRGDVVVLEFWASWCANCKALTPDLARWHKSWAQRGLRVIGIAGDSPKVAQDAVKSWAIPYPVVADPGSQSSAGYAVSALPTVVVVDRRGVVREVMIGYDTKRRVEIERAIDKLLA
jgi:thiol-disulfide isomerase/thioredoxin